MNSPHDPPTFLQALRFWFKLGLISFGGPSGQIAIMHSELVEKKRWISEERFLHALNYCMVLPGPEAQQLATYTGWLLHGVPGGLAAGILFVLPSAFLLLALSWIYLVFGHVGWIAAFFYGLKPAVIAIVASAVLRLGQRALRTATLWTLAGMSFIAIFFFNIPFPLIILSAALLGWIGGKFNPPQFRIVANDPKVPAIALSSPSATFRQTVRTILCCAIVWLFPLVLSMLFLGSAHTITKEGFFFSRAALITFGGAYAVLPYVAQQAVQHFGWLSPAQMVDGLALAETTPGPLIMVLQFVGFVGAWQHPGSLPSLLSGILGAVMTTWVTFAPSFLFIFAGAPYIERTRGITGLTAALSAITAAVVGVILNLAVWFALHTVFPATGRIDWFVLALGIAGLVTLQRWKLEVVFLIPICGMLGILYSFLM